MDQTTYVFMYVTLATFFDAGTGIEHLVIMFIILMPHYSIEFSKHFTKKHVTTIGQTGPAEDLLGKTLMLASGAIFG